MPQMSGKHLRWEMSLYDPNQPWRMDGHYPVGKSGVSQKRNDWEGLQGFLNFGGGGNKEMMETSLTLGICTQTPCGLKGVYFLY